MRSDDAAPITIYCCYHNNRRDRALWERLNKHFGVISRSGQVVLHDCHNISPGSTLEYEQKARLSSANIILILLSSDFVYNDFCWETMLQALCRHEERTAYLVPVLLRHFYYEGAPFAELPMLPEERPVARWKDLDEACKNVVEGVSRTINRYYTQ
jgi:hypothetical protein